MNLFIRIGMLVAGLLGIALLTVLLLAPAAIIDALTRFADLALALRVILVLILYAAVIAAVYFWFRWQPARYSKTLAVRSGGGIASAVTVDSARERVLKSIRGLSSVEDVSARLRSRRGLADIELFVVLDDDTINLPEKQKEIDRALQQVIEKQLGLRMAGRPRVNVQLGGGTAPDLSKDLSDDPPQSPQTPPEEGEPGPFARFFGRRRDRETRGDTDVPSAEIVATPAVPSPAPKAPPEPTAPFSESLNAPPPEVAKTAATDTGSELPAESTPHFDSPSSDELPPDSEKPPEKS